MSILIPTSVKFFCVFISCLFNFFLIYFVPFFVLDFIKIEHNFKKNKNSLPPNLEYEVVYAYDLEDLKKRHDLNNNKFETMSNFNFSPRPFLLVDEGNRNYGAFDLSSDKPPSNICMRQFLLKNVAPSKKSHNIGIYAHILTQMTPISIVQKSEGIWLVTFSSNLGNFIKLIEIKSKRYY